MSDQHDRLIHVLLEEVLGGESPPDLTARILARAPRGGLRRRRWALVATAAAVLAAAAISWWMANGPSPSEVSEGRRTVREDSHAEYPTPKVTGDFQVIRRGKSLEASAPLQRQDKVVVGPDDATLVLGQYCRIELTQSANVVVSGSPREEVIELERGRARCAVQQGKGEFSVVTPRGTLRVIGTEFVVDVKGKSAQEGGVAMAGLARSTVVTVMVVAGAVAYHFGDVTGVLDTGQGKVFAGEGGGTVRGIVVSKAEGLLKLRTEDGEVVFHPRWVKNERTGKWQKDVMFVVGLKALLPGEEVGVEWEPGEEGRKCAKKILLSGTVTGTVVAKKRAVLTLETELGKMNFVTRWIQNEGGRWVPKPSEVALIAAQKIGAKLAVTFSFEEHRRIDKIAPAE